MNWLEKKAGTWSLPYTPEKASKLESLVKKLDEGSFPVYDQLSSLFGDDELYDAIDKITSSAGPKIAKAIRTRVKETLDHFKADPEGFTDKFTEEAIEILEKDIKGLG